MRGAILNNKDDMIMETKRLRAVKERAKGRVVGYKGRRNFNKNIVESETTTQRNTGHAGPTGQRWCPIEEPSFGGHLILGAEDSRSIGCKGNSGVQVSKASYHSP